MRKIHALLPILLAASVARSESFPSLGLTPTLNPEGDGAAYESPSYQKLLEKRGTQCSDFMKFVEGQAPGSVAPNVSASGFDTYGIIVARQNGEVLLEKYYKGADRKTKFKMFSVSKMFTVLSVGNLELKGLLRRDEAVAPYLRDKVAPSTNAGPYEYWDKLKVDHLLTMSSGIPWCEYTNCLGRDGVAMMFGGRKDVISYYFENMKMKTDGNPYVAPGTRYTYSAGNSVVLQAVIKEKLKNAYATYPYDRIFSKMDVAREDYAFETDGKGVFLGGSGMFLTLPAMTKLGLTLLNGGGYGKERLADAGYVRKMTRQVIAPLKRADDHTRAWEGPTGMGVWLNTDDDENKDGVPDIPSFMPDVPRNMFYSSGLQGKRMMMFPEDEKNGFLVARIGVENSHSAYWRQFSKKAYDCFGQYTDGSMNPRNQDKAKAASEPPPISTKEQTAQAAGDFITSNIPIQLAAVELCNCAFVSGFATQTDGKLDKEKTIQRCVRLTKPDFDAVPGPYRPKLTKENIDLDEASTSVGVRLKALNVKSYVAVAQLTDNGAGNRTCQIVKMPAHTIVPAGLIKFLKLNFF